MIRLYNLLKYWFPLLFIILSAVIFFPLRGYILDYIVSSKQSQLKSHILGINSVIKKDILQDKDKLQSNLVKIHTLIPYKHLLVLKDSFLYYGVKDSLGKVLDYSSAYRIDELLYDKDMLMSRSGDFGYNMRRYVFEGPSEVRANYIFYALKFDNYYIRLALPFSSIEGIISVVDRAFIIGFGLLFMFLFLANAYLSKIIRMPLDELVYFAKKFTSNYKTKFRLSRLEEISLLQNSLTGAGVELRKQFIELKRRRKQIEAVVQNVSEGVLILDEKLRIMLVNKGIYKLLNIDKTIYDKGLSGRYYYEIIRNNTLITLIEKSYLENKRIKDEINIASLETRVIEVNAVPLPKGVVVLINDVTDSYNARVIKSDFVIKVADELKGPLSIIRGCVNNLYSMPTLSYKQDLKDILANVELVSNFVRDLTTLNRLDGGDGRFSKELFNVVDLVSRCISNFSLGAKEEEINLISTIKENNIEIVGDKELIYSMFFNLIDNAIKYTPRGGSVIVSCLKEESHFRFSVIDTGIGVPYAERDKIFDRFYAVDKERSRGLGGTGLGLSIIRDGMMMYDEGRGDGVVILDNPTGQSQGSEFRLRFPCAPKPQAVA